MKTREEISKEAKNLLNTFVGFGSTAATGRTQMKMMELEIELLLDIREAILNQTPEE